MKALVVTKAVQTYAVDDIIMVMSDVDASNYSHWLLSSSEFRTIPTALESVPQNLLKGIINPPKWVQTGLPDLSAEPTFAVDTWIKSGVPDVTVDPLDSTYTLMVAGSVDTRYTAIPEEKTVTTKPEYVAYDKQKQITAKYQLMNDDVLASMKLVFGTTQPESASAYEATWRRMIAAPADFSAAGLTSRFVVGTFLVGDLLDTAIKVTDYATAKIAEVDAYSVTRMQRIEQFRNERAAILAL